MRQPKILLINKVDLVDKPALLALAKAANERAPFAATFMISALTGDGVADLKHWLAAHVPEGPWHYPEDQITDAPLRHLAAEITREKLYSRLHQELPYQSTVETECGRNCKDGSVRIEQTIYVDAREPAQDRARQGRADHQGDRRRGAARDRRTSSKRRCICSCSSRCASAGATIPNAIARWDWSFRKSSLTH